MELHDCCVFTPLFKLTLTLHFFFPFRLVCLYFLIPFYHYSIFDWLLILIYYISSLICMRNQYSTFAVFRWQNLRFPLESAKQKTVRSSFLLLHLFLWCFFLFLYVWVNHLHELLIYLSFVKVAKTDYILIRNQLDAPIIQPPWQIIFMWNVNLKIDTHLHLHKMVISLSVFNM